MQQDLFGVNRHIEHVVTTAQSYLQKEMTEKKYKQRKKKQGVIFFH